MPQILTRVRPNRPFAAPLHHAPLLPPSVPVVRRSDVSAMQASTGTAVAARKHHVTAPTKGAKTISTETVQRVDVAHHGRDDSPEMQLLTSVQHSLHAVQAANAASRIARTARSIAKPVQPDSTPQRPLPTQLKTLDTAKPKTVPVASAAKPVSATDDKSTQNSARVQIRLSKKLVRILAAFHKAGQKPSNVIENTMWRDARIQDAATILGMTVPVQQTQEKHKR